MEPWRRSHQLPSGGSHSWGLGASTARWWWSCRHWPACTPHYHERIAGATYPWGAGPSRGRPARLGSGLDDRCCRAALSNPKKSGGPSTPLQGLRICLLSASQFDSLIDPINMKHPEKSMVWQGISKYLGLLVGGSNIAGMGSTEKINDLAPRAWCHFSGFRHQLRQTTMARWWGQQCLMARCDKISQPKVSDGTTWLDSPLTGFL